MIIVNVRPPNLRDILHSAMDRATQVWIASAYVSPEGCEMLSLRDRAQTLPIRVVVGRAIDEGLPETTLRYLRVLEQVANARGGGVRVANPASHAKAYCIVTDEHGAPEAFVGSANLTEHGLLQWHECVVQVDPATAQHVLAEVRRLYNGGATLGEVPPTRQARTQAPPAGSLMQRVASEPGAPGTSPELTISLLDITGNVPQKSGLNWWNAGGRERHPDEAYVPLRSQDIQSGNASAVFGRAERGTTFLAVFHDGTTMEMMLQGTHEKGGIVPKNITSARNTHDFGTWILRNILKIPQGRLVTAEDLERYGRTDITFRRIGTTPNGHAIVFVDFSV